MKENRMVVTYNGQSRQVKKKKPATTTHRDTFPIGACFPRFLHCGLCRHQFQLDHHHGSIVHDTDDLQTYTKGTLALTNISAKN